VHLFTFYVGQGNFAVLVGGEEAIVIDAHMPSANDGDAIFLKKALATVVAGRKVRGLILTSFDADHADVRTVSWILNRYYPEWIMYPGYYKPTQEASELFRRIEEYEARGTLRRHSIRVDRDDRFLPDELSNEWSLEALSPHLYDMTSSNNSSLVLRVDSKDEDGFSYLVTGDTEHERWRSIRRYFASSLDVDVLAAPHHGSRHGIDAMTLAAIDPAHVLISAGIDNQYEHPHDEALEMYEAAGAEVYSTHDGSSWVTYVDEDDDIVTEEFEDWLEDDVA
jgi:competence protein ComEC